MTFDAVLLALGIFLLRVLNYTLATIRLVAITRQMRLLAACLAFIEALVFAVVIANVVTDLNNWVNMLAYCLGASVGSSVGIFLEGRFITSYRTVNIITNALGHEIALALRDAGYGVTETRGEGLDGEVIMLRSVIVRRDVNKFLEVVRSLSPDAFVAVEEARSVQRGWIRTPGGPR